MEKEFLDYTEALELKELGFNEPCLDYFANSNPQNSWTISYNSDDLHRPFESVARPTFSQAFRWFREKHGYLHHITYFDPVKAQTPGEADYQGLVLFPHQEVYQLPKVSYNSYEEAELACLEKLIEIAESKSE